MEKPIPFFDVAAAIDQHRAEIDAAISRVLLSGNAILGPEVAAFEEDFAGYVGSGHAVGVGSGTDALILALRAVGVGFGDEVITVANAGVPPAAAIRAIGARPRYVDVDPETFLIDPNAIAAAVGPNSRALLVVHLYGQALPMAALQAEARRRRLVLIEDCAHAHGLRIDGRHAGRFGAIGCFSFYPTKNLGAFGDAGACVTDDATLAASLRRLRVYGADDRGDVPVAGINSRLDEIQAAVLRVLLRRLDARVARRRELAALYDDLLQQTVFEPLRRDPASDARHLYVVRHPERSRVQQLLESAGIGSKVHYPLPVHRMPAFRAGAPEPLLPQTERACAEVLSLPLQPELEEGDVRRVAAVLARV